MSNENKSQVGHACEANSTGAVGERTSVNKSQREVGGPRRNEHGKTTMESQILAKLKQYSRWSFLQLLKSDIRCYPNLLHAVFHLGFYAALFYRISHLLYKKKLSFPGLIFQLLSQITTGAEISRKAEIGPYLGVLHPSGIHIGPKARIGAWLRICENCSIIHGYGDSTGPLLGDHVFLTAGSKIFGDVVVGDNVEVGLNSVVTKDVMPNSTVFGVPARIVSKFKRQRNT